MKKHLIIIIIFCFFVQTNLALNEEYKFTFDPSEIIDDIFNFSEGAIYGINAEDKMPSVK